MKPGSLFGILSAALIASACDDFFEPIAPGEVQFSVFGYLDAGVDTQWIRVMPIRPLLLTSPDSSDIVVSVEEVGTGRRFELRDSVLEFGTLLEGEKAYVHEYWTAERIEPGASYRLQASRPGEAPAESVVEIPEDYGVELWLRQGQTAPTANILRVEGLPEVAFVATRVLYHDDCGSGVVRNLGPTPAVPASVHLMYMPRFPQVGDRAGCGPMLIDRRDSWVAGSAVKWPSGEEYSDWGMGVLDAPSNISRSVGFFAGVFTKTVPNQGCQLAGPSPLPGYCELRLEGTATLTGTVSDAECGGGGLVDVTVELTELDPPAQHRRTWRASTYWSGAYEVMGIEPSVRHALTVRAPLVNDPELGTVQVYATHTDTLTFSAGEQARLDVALLRLTGCGGEP